MLDNQYDIPNYTSPTNQRQGTQFCSPRHIQSVQGQTKQITPQEQKLQQPIMTRVLDQKFVNQNNQSNQLATTRRPYLINQPTNALNEIKDNSNNYSNNIGNMNAFQRQVTKPLLNQNKKDENSVFMNSIQNQSQQDSFKIKEYEKKIEQLCNELERQANINLEFQKLIEQLKGNNQFLQQQIKQQQENQTQIENQNHKSTMEVLKYQQTNINLEQQIKEMNEKIENLSQIKSEMGKEIQSLSNQCNKLQQELEYQKNDQNSPKGNNINLINQNNYLKQEIERLNSLLKSQDSNKNNNQEISQLKQQYESELYTLKTEINRMVSVLEKKEIEINRCKALITNNCLMERQYSLKQCQQTDRAYEKTHKKEELKELVTLPDMERIAEVKKKIQQLDSLNLNQFQEKLNHEPKFPIKNNTEKQKYHHSHQPSLY